MNLGEHLASRKLAVDQVAAKAKLPTERFAQIAAGADASLAEMRAIAKALRLPLESLLDPEPAEPVKALFRHTLGQREVEVSSEVDVVSAQVRDALAIARGMPGNTGWLDLFRGMEPKFEAAEEFAQLFRKAFAGLDDKEPFPRLPQVAHELGVFILYSRDSAIEGVSAIVEGYALMILGARAFKPRLLFTMAHEFGHLVAHHDDQASGYAHFDRREDFDGIPGAPRKLEEKFADAFGSALVLPRHGVLLAVKAIREQLGAKGPLGDIEILWLAHLFHVSFEVAARRCEGLGLVPPRGARALYQKLQDDYKNPERRAAELGIPPRPDIPVDASPALLQAAARKVRAGEISVGRAAELLNVPVSALFVANAEIAA
ncbi:MAG: ImmA/IrrE family metallo-endopeptidase [Pseudomonadota bacterium]